MVKVKKTNFLFFSILFLILILNNLVACLKSNIIFFGGSSSVTPLFHLLLNGFNEVEEESFQGFNDEYNRKVIYLHNGSSSAEIGVKNKTFTMGFTSRGVKEVYIKDDKYMVFSFGIDKMFIFTKIPKSCPSSLLDITKKNKKILKKLFLGEEVTWKDLLGNECNNNEKLIGINRESGSGTRDMWSKFLDLKDNEQFTNKLYIVNSTSLMISKVTTIKNSIGYISLSSLPSIKDNNLDVFKINGINPEDNDYNELSRKFYSLFLIDIDFKELIQEFISFVCDPKKGRLAFKKLNLSFKFNKISKKIPEWLNETIKICS